MLDKITFVEIEPEGTCWRCGRGKISGEDKFFRVLVGDSPLSIVVCELCRSGFSVRMLEGAEKSYAAHLKFFVRRSLLELKERLPSKIFEELICALENYEVGEYKASFRCIGLVSEWLTNAIFAEKTGGIAEHDKFSWDAKLGKLLDLARRTKSAPEEVVVYQLFSLKWFRNKADHPSEYEITADDARLGLVAIAYLLQWKFALS
jgi:hypothetical protein